MPSVTPPCPVLPGAVSVLSAALLGGAPVPATVLGVHGPALYLDVAGRVLPVVTADAVQLPTALRLGVAGGRVPWGVAAGDVVTVGDGRVVLPGLALVVARTWRPARVRRVRASALPPVPVLAPPSRAHDRSGGHAGASHGAGGHGEGGHRADGHGAGGHRADADDTGWLADGIRALFPRVVCRDGRPGSHLGTRLGEGGVAGLLGRGAGLTPSGDDGLAGALLVAHALGTAGSLAGAVRARLGATTAVSAALLDAAADGFAARDVVTLVDAAIAGDEVGVAAVLPEVLAIGHRSGRDLVTGVAVALDCLTTATTTATATATATAARAAEPADQSPTGRSAA